jgi:lambda family phage portal protein
MSLQSALSGVGSWFAARMDAVRDRPNVTSRAYKGASLDTQETYAWRPPQTSGESATLYERIPAAARARDLVRNDPHALSSTNVLVDMLVGAGLQVAPSPDAYALGLDLSKKGDRRKHRALAHAIKSEWQQFANDPRRLNDAQRRMSLNGQFRLMARTWTTLDEATAFLTWKPGLGRYSTCLRLIDPDRLSNPMGQPDTISLRAGIEYDSDGVPLAYHVRNGHPADWFRFAQTLQWTRIPARTKWGRPVFVHAFEAEREDQSRGMTPLVAAMSRMRMIGKFADTELASATVNALFAAFVTSNLPVDAVTQSFTPAQTTYADKRLEYLQKNPVHLNGVRIPVLPVGDEIKINSSPRQTTAYNTFQTAFLQSIAAARGVSYEQMSMDWSKVNYSSARAALNEVWRSVQRKLAVFTEQAVAPVFYAVIEEAFDKGYIVPPKGAPDFWSAPGAYLSARWIGPARGYVDPVKEAQGATIRMGSFVTTLEKEAADQGFDYEDTLLQIANEEDMIKSFGLTRTMASPGRIANDPNDSDGNAAPSAPPEEKAA